MHTQPWQPFPEDYAYRQNPLADLWFDLERAGRCCRLSCVHGRNPSGEYAPAIAANAQGEAKVEPLSEPVS